jgi:putative transposase
MRCAYYALPVASWFGLVETAVMPNYRRVWIPDGTYFFTVNLLRRHGNDLLVRWIDDLREVVASVKARHPFTIHAWVVLPNLLHCVIELPEGDVDLALRWRLIKSDFSKRLPISERRSDVRRARGERGIWQRRFWEYLVRDERDLAAPRDYVHTDPLRHGLVERVVDWPYSTLH